MSLKPCATFVPNKYTVFCTQISCGAADLQLCDLRKFEKYVDYKLTRSMHLDFIFMTNSS